MSCTAAARSLPAAVLLLTGLFGCFSERSFRFSANQRLGPAVGIVVPESAPPTTRAWLRAESARLAPLLPPRARAPLLTEDLIDPQGRPIDVLGHFGYRREELTTLLGNLSGLEDTAQATGADSGSELPPPWPGFRDIWIPVAGGLEIFGRLGLAQDGDRIRDADCIVILPGIFGDTRPQRTRDLALALRDGGLHALAVELRGFGQTGARYPNATYRFGLSETGDLMAVARWLEAQPHIRRTGIVGFCWGANHALLAAWQPTQATQHALITDALRPLQHPPLHQPVFQAGVLAFSPVLRYEEIIDQCDRDWCMLDNPVLASLQDTIRHRMSFQQYPIVNGSLRDVIRLEYERSGLDPVALWDPVVAYLRWLPYRGLDDGRKLDAAPMPVLIVQGANDPLTSAQNVADLIARTDNPNVAAIVLPGGGHIGFAPYARRWFYNLILDFFDPLSGPAAQAGAARVESAGS